MPDDCSVDLSPSYYDKSCDAPEELQPITPSSGLRVVINTITPVSDSPISVCYYKDGKFSPSNYKDIA